ncbi:MAG: hypothetical protein JSV65_09425 [Armatimonadota bacterium]|nr:MAG: hypothetical protein JSV65_09425 [Armatimonadota bacterium]
MTFRAVATGAVCALLLGIGIPFSDLVMRGTWVGLTAFPISAFFVFALLATAGNGLLRRLRRQAFTAAELLLVFSMMLVAAGIPSFGMTGLLIPYLAGPSYFATPENRYEALFLRYIPGWAAPKNPDAITWLYEGLPAGETIPWGEWVVPLAAWTALVLAVYVVFFCMSAIIRRPWVDHEKLVFPLVQLPIEMAQQRDDPGGVPFLRNRLMWTFFAVPFAIHTMNGLHSYIPAMPYLNVHFINLNPYLQGRPWDAIVPVFFRLPFSIVGLAFLLPTELSFSLWFFYVFFLGQQLVINGWLGYRTDSVQAYPVREFVAHQMIGGIIVFGLYLLWTMRGHLSEVWRNAFSRTPGTDDSREPLSYRAAMIGLIAGLLFIAGWGAFAGAGFLATLGLFVLFFLVHLVAVRLVCEGGMLYVQHPFRPLNMLLAAAGTQPFAARQISFLVYFDHLLMLDNRSPLMPGVVQGYKMSDFGPLPRRGLTFALAGAILIALFASYWSYLRLMYRHGGLSLHTWFTTYYAHNLYSTWTASLIQHGEKPAPEAMLLVIVGALTMWSVMSMHRMFLWWPFHPIGYVMGASWPMINFWFPVFLGWLAKGLVLRFGGFRIYRMLLPGFLGLIFAEFFSAGLWVVVDFITGVKGYEIFSF